MILVIVEHFLSPAGKAYFPEWVVETRQILQHFDGFIKLEMIRSISNKEGTFLMLQFKDMERLHHWASSFEHNQMLEKLAPFRLHKQQSSIFEI